MLSMTGFGEAEICDSNYEIKVEIKSVNSRFLDAKIYLPRELSYLESKIYDLLRKKIIRGKVELRINFNDKSEPELEIDEKKLKIYSDIYKKAADYLHSEQKVSLETLLNLPGIIIIKQKDQKEIEDKLINSIENAILYHKETAKKEGDSMKEYLIQAAEKCEVALDKIKNEFPAHKESIFVKIRDNVETMIGEKIDQEAAKRVMLEVALYVDKADITEEILRLKDHLNRFIDKVTDSAKEKGKNLNFILQEMHREINTIGAKFNETSIFSEIIYIKEEIEKCREIVQNII